MAWSAVQSCPWPLTGPREGPKEAIAITFHRARNGQMQCTQASCEVRRTCISAGLGTACCVVQVADKGPIGLAQHPHRNLLATWSTEGALKLWKA